MFGMWLLGNGFAVTTTGATANKTHTFKLANRDANPWLDGPVVDLAAARNGGRRMCADAAASSTARRTVCAWRVTTSG